MDKRYQPIDRTKIRTNSINDRTSIVQINNFSRPLSTKATFQDFMDSLPGFFAADNIKELSDDIVNAVKNRKPVIFGMGSHVIKVGLAPTINQLIESKVLSAVAFNGSALVHDSEIARFGKTSEKVAEGLLDGSFGMAKETGEFINKAFEEANKSNTTIGQALGKMIVAAEASYSQYSIFASAYKAGIPATVHIAIGTDIYHMQPSADGAAIGEASLRDFDILADVVARLGDGGVYVNIGSAVILPEVFMKALNMSRNTGSKVENFSTANFDFIQHYRSRENILARPVLGSHSKSCAITGHHEIMVPLLAQAILEKI